MDIGKKKNVSRQSRVALDAANFFQAEVTGVLVPFLGAYLRQHHWRYDQIGVPIALAGLGTLVMQTPAGVLIDKFGKPRAIFAVSTLILGACYLLLPGVVESRVIVDSLLFISGLAAAFFAPVMGALALALAGVKNLHRLMGRNQAWNHAGNIASALLAMFLVKAFSTAAIFYSVAGLSIIAALTGLLIRRSDLQTLFEKNPAEPVPLIELFRGRGVLVLVVSTAFFHLANAPVMPMVALYVKKLGGTDGQIAQVVLVAQIVMIPVAVLAGWLCQVFGRKPVFAVGFLCLPVRIFLYSLARRPGTLVALQALDGIGAGIYGVLVVVVSSDLTRGRGHFNALMGIVATALALGGVLGPLAAGFVEQRLGFDWAFYLFAGIALLGAVFFLSFMPETKATA